MPRERTELIRVSCVQEREKMFLLAYEGNKTEPTYFEDLRKDIRFNSDIIEIISLRRHEKDTRSAPKYVFETLEVKKAEYNLGPNDELWMIIDRDRNGKNILKYSEKCHIESNFYFALSNPCFEFWLLLHIADLSEFDKDTLKQILENKKNKKRGKTFLKRLLSQRLVGGYNEADIKTERFLPHIRTALERAKAIDNLNEKYPSSLGTHVYKLVEKILK